MNFLKTAFASTLMAALVGCGGGDINIAAGGGTVANTAPGDDVCASYVDENNVTQSGFLDNDGNCLYSAAFVDFDNPILSDVTIPDIGDNPIFTRVHDTDPIYRNETGVEHILNDPEQAEGCAGFDDAPTRGDIDDRCSYVERQVSEGGDGIVSISTHGEGYNPVEVVEVIDPIDGSFIGFETYDLVEFNEQGGIYIFYEVDKWIQEQLINVGVCPTED